MRSWLKVHSAQHTVRLPEMSAIIRACPGPGGSHAEPHLIKRKMMWRG